MQGLTVFPCILIVYINIVEAWAISWTKQSIVSVKCFYFWTFLQIEQSI